MTRLIKIEWAKFRKNNVIILLTTFFCLFLPTSLYFATIMPTLPAMFPSKDSFFQFPGIWKYIGYSGNWMTFFFLGVVAIYLVSIEVNNKTMRQSIINGLSRKDFFLSKVLSVTIISIGATIIYALLGIIIGIINTDDVTFSKIFDNSFAIPRFFIMTLGYLSFALFIVLWIRKSGIAIFLYISYGIIIEPLIRYGIIEKVSDSGITNYFPLNVFEDLMPNPAFSFAENIPTNVNFNYLLTYTEATIYSIVYIVIFFALSYLSIIKKDV